MKIEVLEEKENPLLNRKEIIAKIVHDDSTPSRDLVRSKAIAKLKAKKDTLILDSIKTRFGARESIAHMRIYGSKGRVLEIEPKHVLIKNSLVSQEVVKKEADVKEKPVKKEKEESKKEEKLAKEEKVSEEAGKEESKVEEKKPEKSGKKAEESKEQKETSAKKVKAKEEST